MAAGMADEADLIRASTTPLTKVKITAELTRMGLAHGDLVLMHTSMSALGWIPGGAQSVLEAVLEVLGPNGTLVCPGFSSQLSDPAQWSSPPVPAEWVGQVQENMPVFHPDRTPTRNMGKVAEALRALPQTQRSHHPVDSFLAHGPMARALLADHPIGHSLGQGSPLGKLYQHGAKVLLLGANFGSCTAFHLAEDGLTGMPEISERYPHKREGGKTLWQEVAQPPTFEAHFPNLGAAYEIASTRLTHGFTQSARLFPLREAVDFARLWLQDAADQGRLSG